MSIDEIIIGKQTKGNNDRPLAFGLDKQYVNELWVQSESKCQVAAEVLFKLAVGRCGICRRIEAPSLTALVEITNSTITSTLDKTLTHNVNIDGQLEGMVPVHCHQPVEWIDRGAYSTIWLENGRRCVLNLSRELSDRLSIGGKETKVNEYSFAIPGIVKLFGCNQRNVKSAWANVQCRGNVGNELRFKRLSRDAVTVVDATGEALSRTIELGEADGFDFQIDKVEAKAVAAGWQGSAVVSAPRVSCCTGTGLG